MTGLLAAIRGQERAVRCRIRSISGFSAHADERELLAWIGAFVEGRRAGGPGVPRRVFLVHGNGNHGCRVHNNTIYVRNGNPSIFRRGVSSV